jgi:ribosome recycling factor
MKRDPELQERKVELLNKRFGLRKMEELKEVSSSIPGESMIERIKDLVETRTNQISQRVSKLSNVTDLDRGMIEDTEIGKGIKMKVLALSISQPNSRTVIVVVKDRGNTERLYKALKREYPNHRVSLMDRERIELTLPGLTDEVREGRGEQVDAVISAGRKELKKLELEMYDEIKKLNLPEKEVIILRTTVRDIFEKAEQDLEWLFKSAMDDLDLDFR